MKSSVKSLKESKQGFHSGRLSKNSQDIGEPEDESIDEECEIPIYAQDDLPTQLNRQSSNSTVQVQEQSLIDSPEEANKRLQGEICNLYLKIKRCSKDTTITESQYVQHMETSEDKRERALIHKMDPFVVLQYISSSIDVIINLKFEDIENKMLLNDKEDSEEDLLRQVEVQSVNSERKIGDGIPGRGNDGLEETPSNIKSKVKASLAKNIEKIERHSQM